MNGDLEEVYRRLSVVEQAIGNHVAECKLLREQHEKDRIEDRDRAARERREMLDELRKISESASIRESSQNVKLDRLIADRFQWRGALILLGIISTLVGICAAVGSVVGVLVGIGR